MRKLIAKGDDPIEVKRQKQAQARAATSFKTATEEFLDLYEDEWKNEKHRKQWRATLETYAFPAIGDEPVDKIDAARINDVLAPIWSKVPETARRVKNRIERVVQWVKDGKPLPTSTASRHKKNHPALPYQEIPNFMAELRSRDSVSARALEFLILTAARTGEVIGARWDEINLKQKLWIVPASRMKAGREHRVPLSDRAVEILKSLYTDDEEGFVFLGARKGAGLSNMAMLELLRGMRRGLTVHGFRSTFSTWASEATPYPNMVTEAALAHVVGDKIEAAYRRGDLFDKRARLMRDWAAYCGKPAVAKTGNVVALRAQN